VVVISNRAIRRGGALLMAQLWLISIMNFLPAD